MPCCIPGIRDAVAETLPVFLWLEDGEDCPASSERPAAWKIWSSGRRSPTRTQHRNVRGPPAGRFSRLRRESEAEGRLAKPPLPRAANAERSTQRPVLGGFQDGLRFSPDRLGSGTTQAGQPAVRCTGRSAQPRCRRLSVGTARRTPARPRPERTSSRARSMRASASCSHLLPSPGAEIARARRRRENSRRCPPETFRRKSRTASNASW